MKKFMRRNRIIMAIVILIMIASLFLVSYLPANVALKELTLENFSYVAEAKYNSIDIAITNDIESTRSMSSRTAIRNKIVDYQNGITTYNELYDFSYDKYIDGYNVIDDVIQALRIVDNTVLLNIGEDKLNISEIIIKLDGLFCLTYEISDVNHKELTVYSPIVFEDDIIGYDVLLYNLNKHVITIQQEGYKIEIVDSDNIDPEIVSTNYINVFQIGSKFQYIKSISDNHSLIIETDINYLYNQVYRISNQNVISTLFIAVIIIIVGNFYIIKLARQIIRRLSNQKEQYHNKMMFDPLTKTFSRNYLEQILTDKALVLNMTSVIMIDVNNFKFINDNNGHLIGDNVLVFIGNTLLSSFRDSDSIIRFGGDEFLVILSRTSKKYAQSIMLRVEEKLKKENSFGFEISVSYGISSIQDLEKLETAIEEADLIMYANKNKGKSYKGN